MKSFILRMTREDQNPGEIEEIIRSLGRFLAAEVTIQTALEVQADHPAIVALLEQMSEDHMTDDAGEGMNEIAQAEEWQPETHICKICGTHIEKAGKLYCSRRCQNLAYNQRRKAREAAQTESIQTSAALEYTPAVAALVDLSGPAAAPALAYQCNRCKRVVAKINQHGLCGQCNFERRPGEAKLQAAIDRVVAQAKEKENREAGNPFVMPAKPNFRSARKVG